MGMGIAFDEDRADFRNMTNTRIWVDRVEHRTVADVNESYTEAAAAITVDTRMKGMILIPPAGFTMVVDHPFLCAIVDNRTGAIIFLGAIVDPGV
jgi:serpin B